MLHEKWGYIALRDHYTRDELDGIFSLGVDVLSSKKDTIRINGEDMPRQQVADRLLSLDFTHIDYVLESLKSVSRPVRNMRSYLLTLLYNAPITIDAYITALIAQNEAKQKERI